MHKNKSSNLEPLRRLGVEVDHRNTQLDARPDAVLAQNTNDFGANVRRSNSSLRRSSDLGGAVA